MESKGLSPSEPSLKREGRALQDAVSVSDHATGPEAEPVTLDEGEGRYGLDGVQSTLRRHEWDTSSPEQVAWIEALRRIELAWLRGRPPAPQLVASAERARQAVLRRARGVRPLEQWRTEARNEPRRRRIVELYRLGHNLMEIAHEVELSRSRVRGILLEEEPGANPADDWRSAVRNEPMRSRCVEMRKSGATISAISREVGVARSRVRTVLREEGIE